MKKKIAFIVQRYGLEVNGGAEYHCRIVAEKLKNLYDVEVLTSCAKNHLTWANDYEEGKTYINDIKVHRFASNSTRDWEKFGSVSRKLEKRKSYQKVLQFWGLLGLYEKVISSQSKCGINNKWVKIQGPNIPGLITYLEQKHEQFNVLIFFTYLYYPTIYGIRVDPEKSILIPTAHDEPPIYFSLFKRFFKTPRAILYNSLSEKCFVNRVFKNENIYSDIVGVGVEPLESKIEQDVHEILKTNCEYLIYIGRVDPAKGCEVLFEHFLNYKEVSDKTIKLVLVGQSFMQIPRHPDILDLGFVDEGVKILLLKNAKALVMPSFFESLSMVTLESMAYGVPVIANKKCEVLKDHIDKSNAGFLYHDFNSFKAALDALLSPNTNRALLSCNAKNYVTENYSWSVVIEKFVKAINYVCSNK